MICRLFGAKPLSESVMICCQLNHKEHKSMKYYFKFKRFHKGKSKYLLRNGGHFFLGLTVLPQRWHSIVATGIPPDLVFCYALFCACSPWARVKFSLIWRDKGGPYFSVGWMPMGHGNPGVEFQKCSYITFSPINTNKTDMFFVTFLWHIFSRVGPWEAKIT